MVGTQCAEYNAKKEGMEFRIVFTQFNLIFKAELVTIRFDGPMQNRLAYQRYTRLCTDECAFLWNNSFLGIFLCITVK